MEEHKILFPKQGTVNYVDFLLRSVREVRAIEKSAITLDLTKTSEVSALLICFLCGLVDLAWDRQNRITLRMPLDRRASRALKTVKYLSEEPGPPKIMVTETMCQLRLIESNNAAALDDMLDAIQYNYSLFTKGHRDSARIILTELLTNAMDHSGEKKCYTCIGTWGKSHNLHLAFLDFGVGIPDKVRTRYPTLEDDSLVIKKLLNEGLTTRQDIEGGKGYRTIQDVLEYNRGRLYIFSGKSKTALKYDRREYEYKSARKAFNGTCIDFQINLDGGNIYEIMDEHGEGLF